MKKILIIGLSLVYLTCLANKEVKEIALSAALYDKKMTLEHMDALVNKYADATGGPAEGILDKAAITFELSLGLKNWSKKLRSYSNRLKNQKLVTNPSFDEIIQLYAKQIGEPVDSACNKANVGITTSDILNQWSQKLKKYSEDLTVQAYKRQD